MLEIVSFLWKDVAPSNTQLSSSLPNSAFHFSKESALFDDLSPPPWQGSWICRQFISLKCFRTPAIWCTESSLKSKVPDDFWRTICWRNWRGLTRIFKKSTNKPWLGMDLGGQLSRRTIYGSLGNKGRKSLGDCRAPAERFGV